MRILGIESSCDECAAAVVADGSKILSQVVASQVDVHARFGGVVPEIASRCHLESIVPVIEEALDRGGTALADLGGVAITHRPGLIGALLVGLSAAKGLALATGLPLIPVHHIEAHIYAALMETLDPPFPLVALVVSGGHTSLYRLSSLLETEPIGHTLDDAAGEAFDKVGSILGLSYPGGPSVEKAAQGRGAGSLTLPRSMPGREGYDFSFSGLKTAVLYHCQGNPGRKKGRAGSRTGFDAGDTDAVGDVAASFQAAVVDVLVKRTFKAAVDLGAAAVALGGGVAANERLRQEMTREAGERGLPLFMPPKHLATDNAAMVAGLGFHLLKAGRTGGLDMDAFPS